MVVTAPSVNETFASSSNPPWGVTVLPGPDDAHAALVPTLHDVIRARRAISPYLSPTPVVTSPALDERLGFNAYFKCENLQPTRAFKVRGGINLLSQLTDDERGRTIVTASSGNHGQSIAYAAKMFGAEAVIFVPEAANPDKVASMRRLGARVEFAGRDFDECCLAATTYVTNSGAFFVHPANEPRLIAGVATYTLELLESHPDLQTLIVPAGGGSGLSGASITGKAINPDLSIIGVQATGAPAIQQSWQSRSLLQLDRADTFAEGVATRVTFSLPAHAFWDRVDDIVLVSDDEMRSAILTLLETTGMLAEGAGAAALAAAYTRRHMLAGRRVGIVISGGNLTLAQLRQTISEAKPW